MNNRIVRSIDSVGPANDQCRSMGPRICERRKQRMNTKIACDLLSFETVQLNSNFKRLKLDSPVLPPRSFILCLCFWLLSYSVFAYILLVKSDSNSHRITYFKHQRDFSTQLFNLSGHRILFPVSFSYVSVLSLDRRIIAIVALFALFAIQWYDTKGSCSWKPQTTYYMHSFRAFSSSIVWSSIQFQVPVDWNCSIFLSRKLLFYYFSLHCKVGCAIINCAPFQLPQFVTARSVWIWSDISHIVITLFVRCTMWEFSLVIIMNYDWLRKEADRLSFKFPFTGYRRLCEFTNCNKQYLVLFHS